MFTFKSPSTDLERSVGDSAVPNTRNASSKRELKYLDFSAVRVAERARLILSH
jgi:hypothetical protein